MQSLLHPTSTKFLTGIIPTNWTEVILEYDNYYMIHVTGDAVTEDEWEYYVQLLRSEFAEQFDEVYRLPEDKTSFQVFLHKSNEVLV